MLAELQLHGTASWRPTCVLPVARQLCPTRHTHTESLLLPAPPCTQVRRPPGDITAALGAMLHATRSFPLPVRYRRFPNVGAEDRYGARCAGIKGLRCLHTMAAAGIQLQGTHGDRRVRVCVCAYIRSETCKGVRGAKPGPDWPGLESHCVLRQDAPCSPGGGRRQTQACDFRRRVCLGRDSPIVPEEFRPGSWGPSFKSNILNNLQQKENLSP